MVMGERGMGDVTDMTEMEMPLPDNTVPMMGREGPFGSVEMGGMFTVIKLRAETTMKHAVLVSMFCAVQIGLAAAFAHGTEHHAGEADAIGEAGKAEEVSRTVDVEMSDDMRFKPSSIAVRQGETIRFVVRNAGRLRHEFVLGTTQSLREHNEFMKKFPEMEHADANMVTVAPGKTGEVVWRFTRSGEVDFACLQPGHYDAGMKGAIRVAAAKGATMGGVAGGVPGSQKSDPAPALANNEGSAGISYYQSLTKKTGFRFDYSFTVPFSVEGTSGSHHFQLTVYF